MANNIKELIAQTVRLHPPQNNRDWQHVNLPIFQNRNPLQRFKIHFRCRLQCRKLYRQPLQFLPKEPVAAWSAHQQ